MGKSTLSRLLLGTQFDSLWYLATDIWVMCIGTPPYFSTNFLSFLFLFICKNENLHISTLTKELCLGFNLVPS